MNGYSAVVMSCCGDMQKSIFIYIVVQVLQLSGGSDDGRDLSCRLSRTSLHSGFHRCCFCEECIYWIHPTHKCLTAEVLWCQTKKQTNTTLFITQWVQ